MTLTNQQKSSWAIAIAWCMGIALGSATARGQDARQSGSELADQVRRLEKVATQRLEAQVRGALKEAEKAAPKDAEQAVERLKQAIAVVEEDAAVPQQRRDSLKRMLQDRIRITQEDANKSSQEAETRARKQAAAQGTKDDLDKKAAETEQINIKLNNIKDLQNQGKTGEASREATQFAEKHPLNLAIKATDKTAASADAVANHEKVKREFEQRLLAAYRDIERSTVLPNGEVEFPKDWKEKTKNRTSTVQLTEREKSILRSLNTPISVNFKNSKFDGVIEYLSTITGQPIIVDPEAMKEVEVGYDTPVSAFAKGASVRTILRKILADLGMTYIIKDESIQVTSAQRAKETMVVRSYYVGDILNSMWMLDGATTPLNPGSQLNQAIYNNNIQNQMIMMQRVKPLMEMIEMSCEPSSWKSGGGNGTVSFHGASMSLVIKQSAEVHALLGNSLFK